MNEASYTCPVKVQKIFVQFRNISHRMRAQIGSEDKNVTYIKRNRGQKKAFLSHQYVHIRTMYQDLASVIRALVSFQIKVRIFVRMCLNDCGEAFKGPINMPSPAQSVNLLLSYLTNTSLVFEPTHLVKYPTCAWQSCPSHIR